MKKFEKLSRAEMKNVMGGVSEPPACKTTSTVCSAYYTNQFGANYFSGHCNGGGGPQCYCTDGIHFADSQDCYANGGA